MMTYFGERVPSGEEGDGKIGGGGEGMRDG